MTNEKVLANDLKNRYLQYFTYNTDAMTDIDVCEMVISTLDGFSATIDKQRLALEEKQKIIDRILDTSQVF